MSTAGHYPTDVSNAPPYGRGDIAACPIAEAAPKMPYASVSRVCYTVSYYEYVSLVYPERASIHDQSQDLRYHHKRRRSGGGGGGCRYDRPELLSTESALCHPRTGAQHRGASTAWLLRGGGVCQ